MCRKPYWISGTSRNGEIHYTVHRTRDREKIFSGSDLTRLDELVNELNRLSEANQSLREYAQHASSCIAVNQCFNCGGTGRVYQARYTEEGTAVSVSQEEHLCTVCHDSSGVPRTCTCGLESIHV